MMEIEIKDQRVEKFKEKVERIKQHFKDNKKVYLVGGGALLTGLLAGLATANRPQVKNVVDSYKIQYKSPTINEITTILTPRGNPGKPVRWEETGEVAASINRMAEISGCHPLDISRNVRGLRDNVKGNHFSLIDETV